MAKLSIVSSCYNEEGNVEELYERVKHCFDSMTDNYDYEHILLDNCSTDNTWNKLKGLAVKDKKVKIIANARNFGHIRSPFYGIIQGTGDAVIYMASDLQDPPELIPDFIRKWEEGYKMVLGIRKGSDESLFFRFVRRTFYSLIKRIADDETKMIKNYTGFGLYDKKVIDILRNSDDPYPYFRGLVSDIGFDKAEVMFHQPTRKKGITKNNFYTLYDNAMLGITKHSRVPLRLILFAGFGLSIISLMVAIGYLVAKLIFWNKFPAGTAPILIGLFFFSSVQLFFIGIIGEYVGAILTRVNKRPLVVERERINF